MLSFNRMLVSDIQTRAGYGMYDPTPELRSFMRDIETALGCKTACVDSSREAWVYMPDDLFAMGKIGYGRYVGGKKAEVDFYMVQSRRIENNKYSDGTASHHQYHTTKHDTAMAHAKRYLRRFVMTEYDAAYNRDFSTLVSNIRTAAYSEVNDLSRNVLSSAYGFKPESPLMREVFRMIEAGHTFSDPELNTNLGKLKQASETIKGHTTPDEAHLVYMHPCPTMPYVSVLPITRPCAYDAHYNPSKRYAPDDVPEEISGAVAVLSMLDDETYIEGVGAKINDRVFYVTK